MNEDKMKKRKAMTIAIIALFAILVIVGGATYAYFVLYASTGVQGKVNATTADTDAFLLQAGDPIDIQVDSSTFYDKAGNRSDYTTATAILKIGNPNSASATTTTKYYHLYLDVLENNFIYTTVEKKPEILLNITGPNGQLGASDVTNLPYREVEDGEGNTLSGFDITERVGAIVIKANYSIQATKAVPEKTDQWTATITFVNLDTDQSANNNKVFDAKLNIQKYINFASLCKNDTLEHCVASAKDLTNYLYYHNGTIKNSNDDIIDAEDGSYRFRGNGSTGIPKYATLDNTTGYTTYRAADNNTYYRDSDNSLIRFYCEKDGEYYKNYSSFYYRNNCQGEGYSGYYYLGYNENGIPYSNWLDAIAESGSRNFATYDEAYAQVKKDGFYIDSLQNYVCFGSDEGVCPNDNLYRIIGLFNEDYHGLHGKRMIKLIKDTYATTEMLGTNGDFRSENKYYWNKFNKSQTLAKYGVYNVWKESALNTINLNTNFLEYLGSLSPDKKWVNAIETASWYPTKKETNITLPKDLHEKEVGLSKDTSSPYDIYQAKIGLPYQSELAFSRYSSEWDRLGRYGTSFLGKSDIYWTISPSDTDSVYYGSDSYLNYTVVVDYDYGAFVYPTFYIRGDIKIINGAGTKSSPFRIEV